MTFPSCGQAFRCFQTPEVSEALTVLRLYRHRTSQQSHRSLLSRSDVRRSSHKRGHFCRVAAERPDVAATWRHLLVLMLPLLARLRARWRPLRCCLLEHFQRGVAACDRRQSTRVEVNLRPASEGVCRDVRLHSCGVACRSSLDRGGCDLCWMILLLLLLLLQEPWKQSLGSRSSGRFLLLSLVVHDLKTVCVALFHLQGVDCLQELLRERRSASGLTSLGSR